MLIVDELFSLPGSNNLADTGTNTDKPLYKSLQFMLHTRKISLDLTIQEARPTDR